MLEAGEGDAGSGRGGTEAEAPPFWSPEAAAAAAAIAAFFSLRRPQMLRERARPDPPFVGAPAASEVLSKAEVLAPLGKAVLVVETESRDADPKVLPPPLACEVTGRLRLVVELGRVGMPLVKGKAGGGWGKGDALEADEWDVVGRMICSLWRYFVLLLEAPPPAAEPDERVGLSDESMYLGL